MSLLERARQKALADQTAKEKAEQAERAQKESLNRNLATYSEKLLDGLHEFHGIETKHGTLFLQRKVFQDQIAVLTLVKPGTHGANIDLLYIKASIVSGERDYSDDCRNMPFTEAQVSICTEHVKDMLKTRHTYHRLECVGLQGFNETISHWNDDVSKTLGKVADWLAPLFTTKA
jgi:hypothetical protein